MPSSETACPAQAGPRRAERLGLFGGSFNPPHVGHLIVAETAADALGLDRVVWVPAATSPHKQGDPSLAAAADRLAMARLATEGNPRFEVSDREVERAGVSYTVDTVAAVAAERPEADLVLLVGGDSLAGFASWREPRRILAHARLAVYARPGADLAAVPGWVSARTTRVDAPLLATSSTQIRADLAAGTSVRYRVPEAVRSYIEARGLYGTNAAAAAG